MVTLKSYEFEIDRINEWLFNNKGSSITDRETYEMFLKDEIFGKERLSDLENKILNSAFKKYADEHGVSQERVINKQSLTVRVQPKTKKAIKGFIRTKRNVRQIVFLEPVTFKKGTKTITAYRDVRTKRFAKDTM